MGIDHLSLSWPSPFEGLYLHSGVYTYVDAEDGKDTTKTLGMNPDYSNDADEEEGEKEAEGMTAFLIEDVTHKKETTMRELLLMKALPSWKKPSDPKDEDTWPEIEFLQRVFVTAGSAVVSKERFKLAGRWTKKPRHVQVHEAGLKRRLMPWKPEFYFSTPEREADRCHGLVPTMPALNPAENPRATPSATKWPKWLELKDSIVFENVFADDEIYDTGEIMEAM